ncbi:hypothetical protein OESDEN_04470 [Oesophagostomum dentatum]|uniref:VWFA domain-containing protein n=1 Tax=Oesophagostomum dentatum TaxID=61180 RepID=A0A0B1TIF8_OESDE|nr:hypothetical protein OESDEN_04470 [Oesophagostomum dentatum]
MSTDSSGRPIGAEARVKEIKSTARPTDSTGREIPPVVGPDGVPLKINEEGELLDSNGNPIIIDEEGVPRDPFGKELPQNKDGAWIYPLVDKTGKPLPLDENNMPVIKVVDSSGNELPLDEAGHPVDPIRKSDGSPLPTDSSGNYITDEGTVIEKDDEGRPLGPDGEVLPTDDAGNYIYPVLGPDGKPLPTDENQRPIHPVLGSDGSPLPTDRSGRPLGEDGRPIPTDASGRPVDKDGTPLPTDSSGNYVTAEGVAPSKEYPTDESGNVIYPVRKSDGSPLPTDSSGNYITDDGTIIEKDDEGRPLGPDGEVLPTDISGDYIYPALGPDGKPLPTDEFGLPLPEGVDMETALRSKQCAEGEPTTDTLLFIVQSSHESSPYLDPIKNLLREFVNGIPDGSMPKVGKLIYGATTEVTVDIGHYKDKEELLNSFDEIREIRGSPDARLALKIALQLLQEEERGATVVLHFHVTPLSIRDSSLAEGMRSKGVKLVHLDEKIWSKEDPSALQKFVCLREFGK